MFVIYIYICVYIYIYIYIYMFFRADRHNSSPWVLTASRDLMKQLPDVSAAFPAKMDPEKSFFVIAASLIFTLFLIIICYPAGLDLDALL